MYCIMLNKLEGVEYILSALRGTGHIQSMELANGIEKHLLVSTEDGSAFIPLELDTPVTKAEDTVKVKSALRKVSHLRLVK